MADDEQNQQPPRYWFPYWSGPPQPPPPSRPQVRPQLSRRLSPPSPAAAPSSPRRPSPSQPRQLTTTTAATRGGAPPSPPQSQVPRPSPSRTSPLAPREPTPPSNNSNAGGAATPAPAKLPAKPVVLPAVPGAAPRQKDVDVVPPPEKPIAHGHGKAADKEHKAEKKEKDEHKSKDKEKEKDHKEKEKEKDEHKSKDREKEKDHKEKEKEKEKEKKHHASEDAKSKEVKAEQGKLHREIKAGVADMVNKASGAAASGSGLGTSVITLAGENKGASMNVGGGKSKDGGQWHGYRLDGGSDGKKAAGKAGMMTALINSNVQVINNSLLLQSSCSGGDPGVHLKLSAKSGSKDKQKHAGAGDKAAAGKK